MVDTTNTIENKIRSKSDVKGASILAAASQLFCELGYAATSMDKVAKAAGVSKQTVYSHYGNKEELFKAAIACRCIDFRKSSIPSAILADPKQFLTTFSHNFLALLMSDEGIAIHRICCFESQTNPQVSQLFYSAGPEPLIAELASVFANYHEQRLLEIDDFHCAAIQFLTMIKGEAMMRLEYNTQVQLNESEITDYINKTVKFFLVGYRYTGKL